MDMFVNASALSAFSSGMQATAHNIANVSTDGFRSQTYSYRSGSNDRGVQFVTSGANERDTPSRGESPAVVNEVNHMGFHRNDVELPREITHMITDQRAFEANAAAIRTYEEVSGVVLDLIG